MQHEKGGTAVSRCLEMMQFSSPENVLSAAEVCHQKAKNVGETGVSWLLVARAPGDPSSSVCCMSATRGRGGGLESLSHVSDRRRVQSRETGPDIRRETSTAAGLVASWLVVRLIYTLN